MAHPVKTEYSRRPEGARIVNELPINKCTFLGTILQYSDYDCNTEYYDDDDVDPQSRNFFTQKLFSYKINPQTVFFLGYSDNYGNRDYEDNNRNADNSLIQKNRTIFTKIGYAWFL